MKNILLVDDDVQMRQMLKTALENHDFQVIEAANGLEGLEKAQEHNFQCIVSDLKMPMMDGLEFVEELRKLPNLEKSCPIIVCSNITQDYPLEEALKRGATKVLQKDLISPQEFVDAVKSVTDSN